MLLWLLDQRAGILVLNSLKVGCEYYKHCLAVFSDDASTIWALHL